MRKCYLENLPIYKNGRYKGKFNWQESIGHKVKFIYDDIEGLIEILDYIKIKQKLLIKYKEKVINKATSDFIKCELGALIGAYGNHFKIEIGQTFKDDKRNVTIVDREYRKNKHGKSIVNDKWYKYKCNVCVYEGWIVESSLLNGTVCSCCSNKTIVKGINDISTTNPEMIKYFVNIKDCYTHTYCSGDKILMKCPICKIEKEMKINTLCKYGFSCPQCSDGISYPEKIMYNFLNELDIEYIYQYSKTNNEWCNNYRYDFYFKINNEEYTIEAHGLQHYEESFETIKSNKKILKLKEIQENDKNKKELALKNGIKEEHYIVIDCRKSDLDFIKNNILHSRLNEVFDLNNIDWIKIGQDSEKSLVKEVCDYWNDKNEYETTNDLSIIFKVGKNTIIKYLKKGNKVNWCNYNPKYEVVKDNMKKSKQVEIFKDNISLGSYISCKELERKSIEDFGVKLFSENISSVCLDKINQYKGYTFKYI